MQISFVDFKFFKPMNWRKRSTEARDAIVRCCLSYMPGA